MFSRNNMKFKAEKLWQCCERITIEIIDAELLKPVLDAWLWFEGTPNEVCLHKTKPDLENHFQRILDCDISYPIIICDKFVDDEDSSSIQGPFDVLDGLHRLYRLIHIEKASHICVKKISHDVLMAIKE